MATHRPRALTELVAVRHGESTANVRFARVAAGVMAPPLPEGRDADVPLSPRGVAQATALGRWLVERRSGTRPQAVVCSPFLRARHTWRAMAAEAARLGVPAPPVRLDDRLRDRDMGEFTLLTPTEIRTRAPAESERRATLGDWAYRPPGGESLADVTSRVRGFMADVTVAPDAERVLLVAHDAVLLALRAILAGDSSDAVVPDRPLPPASVTRWIGNGTAPRLVEYGDTRHLTESTDGR